MNSDLKDIDHKHLWHPFTQSTDWLKSDPLIIERGEGVELIDINGKRYLDGVSSLWCNVHGHCVPELNQVMLEQIETLTHSTLLGLSHRPILELTKKLLEFTPKNLTRAFYCDSGSNAVEAALRMALEYFQKQNKPTLKKRTKFVSLLGAYHGDTLGAVNVGYVREFHAHLDPVLVASIRVSPPHYLRKYKKKSEAEALKEAIAEVESVFKEGGNTIAAFIIEPIVQGAAGIWIHEKEYLEAVYRIAKAHGAFLICDEVATGFGKTGEMFASQLAEIEPDILVLGKGLSAGHLAISCALTTEEIFSGFLGEPAEFKTFFYGQTFAGNPLAARVGVKSLELFVKNNLLEKAKSRAEHLKNELAEKIAPLKNVDEVRQQGLMCGIEFSKMPGRYVPFGPNDRFGARVASEARARGAIIRPLGNVMVLMPAPVMQEADLTRLVEITKESIEAVINV